MIRIGLIGFGTVGTGVLKILRSNARLISDRVGVPLTIVRIADRDLARRRDIRVSPSILTRNARDIIADPTIPVIIELVGGVGVAKDYILEALRQGKHVVTANKALLAEHGAEIFNAVRDAGVHIGFEASVAGGIPIIKAIREGLVGNRISSIRAIINGTSNYILTRMFSDGIDVEDAIALARKNGYAEADPSLDVDGIDAAHKLAILILLAFGKRIRVRDIHTEGIRSVSRLDMEFARDFGYRIKLLAIAAHHGETVEARVHPAMVPAHSQLAMVESVYNAIHITGDASGPLVFSGQGAGMMAAASAVVSDLADVARMIIAGSDVTHNIRHVHSSAVKPGRVHPLGDIMGKYYIRFTVVDRPGVLAQIARVLGDHGISIARVVQKGQEAMKSVPVVILTHGAPERKLAEALRKTVRLSAVKAPPTLLRIEEEVL